MSFLKFLGAAFGIITLTCYFLLAMAWTAHQVARWIEPDADRREGR